MKTTFLSRENFPDWYISTKNNKLTLIERKIAGIDQWSLYIVNELELYSVNGNGSTE